MTVEQLNVIITAQTSDFRQKINEVNAALSETVKLAKESADGIASITVSEPESEGFSKAAAVSGVPDIPEEKESLTPFWNTMGAQANVLSMRRGDTLIGAVADSDGDGSKGSSPIEIHTTVELDGEKIGESVNAYNSSRKRVLNGWG